MNQSLSFLPPSGSLAFNRASASTGRKFNDAYDQLLSDIWFPSEAIAILPPNVEKTKAAFKTFFTAMGWDLANHSFDELLKEKSGQHAYRKDGITPNFYHEFRQCLFTLNQVRNGLINRGELATHGGAESLVSIILRHDSWEDFGHSPDMIMAQFRELIERQGLNPDDYKNKMSRAKIICYGVDLLTRTIPMVNEKGEFVIKENGKIIKNDRFKGQIHLYYNRVMSYPLTAEAKYCDGIEGMSTRVGVSSYSVEDDRKYTRERRELYGNIGTDNDIIQKFPFLKKGIKSLDAMLGICLVHLETLNFYALEDGQDPEHAPAIRIEKYSSAARGFEGLPPWVHPANVMMERAWAKAERDKNGRMEKLIQNAYLPPLEKMFPNITIYSMPSALESAARALPKGAAYAPMML